MKKKTILIYFTVSILLVGLFFYVKKSAQYNIITHLKSFSSIDLSLMKYDENTKAYDEKNIQTFKQTRNQFYSNAYFEVENIDDFKKLRLDLGDANGNNIFIDKILVTSNKSSKETDTIVQLIGGQQIKKYFSQLENVVVNSVTENAIAITTTSPDAFFVFDNQLFQEVSNHAGITSSISKKQFDLLFSILLYSFFVCSILLSFHLFFEKIFSSVLVFFQQYFLLFAFGSVLLFMFVNFQFDIVKDTENKEKRNVPAYPAISKISLQYFPTLFEKYFNVSFPLRNYLFEMHAYIAYKVFHSSPLQNDVLIGKEDFLFENDKNVISDFTLTTKYDTLAITTSQAIMQQRRNWLDKKGIKFYVLFAPNKNQVYPEMMPSSFNQKPGFGINQLTEYTSLLRAANITTINPVDRLKAAKKNRLCYYKSDTHWNLYGGFIAYQHLMDSIRKDFPDIATVKEEDFDIKTQTAYNGDLAYMCSIEKYIPREDVYMQFKDPSKKLLMPNSSSLMIKFKDNPTLENRKLKVLMFRDSYANYMIPFINLHFSDATYVWSYEFMDKLIEEEKPDVVIFESLQRFVPYSMLIANAPAVYETK